MATYDALKTKIARIEQALAQVRQELEQLAAGSSQRRPASIHGVDKTGWGAWFGDWLRDIGIENQPMGAEALQALMRQEGVRPDDNLLSQGIIDMRDE